MNLTSELSRELVIWDADGNAPVGDWISVLWRGLRNDASQDAVSIPEMIEADAEVLRSRYLAWVYEFGERRIHGRRLVDHLEARPGFSFWWMTLLAEKCNFSKSPQITDAISLLAFENWLSGRTIRKIVLVSAKRPLAECIRLWCLRTCVTFEWQRPPDKPQALSLIRRLHQYLPYSLQALIWLMRHLFHSWPLRGSGLSQWKNSNGNVTFFSYLFNLVPEAVKAGRFESRYWSHLPNELNREGCETNWLHLYVKNPLLPNEATASGIIRQFNATGSGVQAHVTLETFLNGKVVFKAMLDALRLALKAKRLQRDLSKSSGSLFNLWPLFEDDWMRSTSGLIAISNALYLNLFEEAMRMLPKQRLGVYLQENQGWEFAFIHAWKSAGHGHLVGTPHSTVRFWDLRYFFDPRSYQHFGKNALPMPEFVALNGVAELNAYKNGGYPVGALFEVEALRFLHLAKTSAKPNYSSPSTRFFLRILVLGDYLFTNTWKQMQLLEKALPRLPEGTIILFKPHPACVLRPADFPGIVMEVTLSPVCELISECDVAYTSNATSAAVDAYCAGLPIISMLDLDALNQSPLRGFDDVYFVSTPENLAHILLSVVPHLVGGRQKFFTIDLDLPRWKRLLLEPIELADGRSNRN